MRDLEDGLAAVHPETGELYATTSWAPVGQPRLDAALMGGGVRPPEFLTRTDGVKLLYPGRRHAFWGPSETFKSWLALVACRAVIEAGGRALYVDFEDDEVGFVDRTRALALPDEWLGRKLGYVRPEEPLSRGRGETVLDFEALLAWHPALVVLDGVTEAMSLQGLHPYDPKDTAKYQHLLARPWDAAVIEVDHTGKDGSTGQLGSQQKRAGLDGVSVEFVKERNEGRGGHSVARLYVRKDRHGHVRQHCPDEFFGRFHLITSPGLPPEAYIDPTRRSAVRALLEEVAVEERVVAWLRDHPGALTREVKDARLGPWQEVREVLEGSSEIRRESGARNAVRWSVVSVPSVLGVPEGGSG